MSLIIFFFTALMDTRDYLFSIIQDRNVPMKLRRQKLLACAHDFQLALDKNELFQWEDIRARHERSGFGEGFQAKVRSWAAGKVLLQTKILMLWHLIQIAGIVILPHWN